MLRHLADIESDMSAIHRVDDMYSMPAPRFFRLAWRLPAYEGVMRQRALAEQAEPAAPAAARPAGGHAGPASPQRREVPAVRTALATDPDLQGIFSFSGSAHGG